MCALITNIDDDLANCGKVIQYSASNIYVGLDFAIVLILQYRNLYTISNNIEVYEGPVSRTKKIPHCAVKFEAGKENRIDTKFLYWISLHVW